MLSRWGAYWTYLTMNPNDLLVFVPARLSSKRVPRKNIQEVGGISLVERVLNVVRECGLERQTVVSTDDPSLLPDVGEATVLPRPPELASDQTTMDELLHGTLGSLPIELSAAQTLLLLQPTSPFRKASTVEKCLKLHASMKPSPNGVMTVTPTREDLWEKDEDGILQRAFPSDPRLQQLRPTRYVENGACYVFSISAFIDKGSIGAMKFVPVEVDEDEALDINTAHDLERARFYVRSQR